MHKTMKIKLPSATKVQAMADKNLAISYYRRGVLNLRSRLIVGDAYIQGKKDLLTKLEFCLVALYDAYHTGRRRHMNVIDFLDSVFDKNK